MSDNNQHASGPPAVLASRAIIWALVVSALLVLALALSCYALYDYANSSCYVEMHKVGLDRESAERFKTARTFLKDLRNGNADVPKWDNPEFQDAVSEAWQILAQGRHALKNQDAYAALNALSQLKQALAKAKRIATDRVNHILQVQDPSDYDGFEKYRLEGKNLVEIVKRLDAQFETIDAPNRALPGICNW